MLSPRSILVCIWEILHFVQDDGFSSYWRSCWPCEALCYIFERSFTSFKMTVLYIQDDSSWSINSFIDIGMIVYIDRMYTSLTIISSSTIILYNINTSKYNLRCRIRSLSYGYVEVVELVYTYAWGAYASAWEFESPLRHICVYT